MGIKFGAAKGQAKKSNIEQYTYKNGDNVVRMSRQQQQSESLI